jgi:hypothetical protein
MNWWLPDEIAKREGEILYVKKKKLGRKSERRILMINILMLKKILYFNHVIP